jgi:hypothetical protein
MSTPSNVSNPTAKMPGSTPLSLMNTDTSRQPPCCCGEFCECHRQWCDRAPSEFGAVATMRPLADPAACVAATRYEFWGLYDTVHKAASGGRYLAVQLLVDACSQGRADVPVAVDNIKDPVEVARDKQQDQDESRRGRRWDAPEREVPLTG